MYSENAHDQKLVFNYFGSKHSEKCVRPTLQLKASREEQKSVIDFLVVEIVIFSL